jgi:putative transposase
MKRSRYTEEQIIGILKEQEAGAAVVELCRRHGMSDATFLQMGEQVRGSRGQRGEAAESDRGGEHKAEAAVGGGDFGQRRAKRSAGKKW